VPFVRGVRGVQIGMRAIASMLLGILWLGAPAHAGDLPKLSDARIADLVARMEILEELEDLPFFVRIARLRGAGECKDSPESCPKTVCYMVASTRDEANQSVFVLPEAADWTFVSVSSTATGEGKGDFAELELMRKVPKPKNDRAESWFGEETVRVRINPWSASIEP
jgi:hypothetical protein